MGNTLLIKGITFSLLLGLITHAFAQDQAAIEVDTKVTRIQSGSLATVRVKNPNGAALLLETAGGTEKPQIMFKAAGDGTIRAMVNNEGLYYTNGWMTISGNFQTLLTNDGEFQVVDYGHSGRPTMLDVVSDVADATAVFMGSPAPGSYGIQILDVNRRHNFRIDNDGQLKWGTGADRDMEDTNLYRESAGVLKTDGSLEVSGGITLEAMAEPVAPTAGKVVLYLDIVDGNLKAKNANGEVSALTDFFN